MATISGWLSFNYKKDKRWTILYLRDCEDSEFYLQRSVVRVISYGTEFLVSRFFLVSEKIRKY